MIRGPYNSNKHSSYVEIVIVVDNKAFKSFNENIKKVHQHCKDLANIMNAVSFLENINLKKIYIILNTIFFPFTALCSFKYFYSFSGCCYMERIE